MLIHDSENKIHCCFSKYKLVFSKQATRKGTTMRNLFLFFALCAVILLQVSLANGPISGYVNAIAVSGTNIYAGTWGNGIFRSSDNGANWYEASEGLTNPYVNTLLASGTNLFAGTNSGVFLSTNNGETWIATGIIGGAGNVVNTLAASGTNLFVGTQGGGVFRSTNNGANWTAVNSGLSDYFINTLIVSGTNLFAGTYGNGIFRSTNNGTNWTSASIGLENAYIRTFALSGTKLFAGTWSGGVFLSTDNGANWNFKGSSMMSFASINALVPSGTNLFAGSNLGVFRTTNDGTSWTQVNTGLTNTMIAALAVSGSNIFAGTKGGGIFCSTNSGGNWASSGLTNAYLTRDMILKFNGHDHPVPDIISEELNKQYRAEKENVRTSIYNAIYAKEGVTEVYVLPPDNISAINFSGGTGGKGRLELRFNKVEVDFNLHECRFDTEFDLIIKADIEIISDNDKTEYKLVISNTEASNENFWCKDAASQIPGWYAWMTLDEPRCEIEEFFLNDIYSYFFIDDYKEKVEDGIYPLVNLHRLPSSGLTIEQIDEAKSSFPLSFSITGGANQDLVIGINFLTAFESFTPDAVTDKTFEHIGFNLSRGSLYDAFGSFAPNKRPFTTTEESGNPAQRDFIIQNMKGYLGRSVSFYFHWGDIATGPATPTLPVSGELNPDQLTEGPGGTLEQKITELYTYGTWQKSTDIINSLHNSEFDVVATVGTPGTIKNSQGVSGTMAPDRIDRGINGDYFYVDKNTYLYYLKIFAHAVIRKYKDQIGVWLIQPELNASKFSSLLGFGNKKGNCWDEEGNTNDKFQWQVWRTWVDAVQAEDPTAKVSTALHMLKMQYGLETFGPECDIISVNSYPNELFATPVLGFAVGEMVWGVRRALKGMGMGNKPVWITETNYPGVIDNNADKPPVGTTIESNLVWYSYGRQGKYMSDAIYWAAEYGAKGFFWWHFLDSDAGYPPFPYTGYGSLIVGNEKDPVKFKQPAVTAFQTKSSAKHPGKSQVTLTNKAVSAPGGNLGGTIGIYSERDNLASGTSVFTNINRNHISATYSQTLSSQKHQSWGNQNPSASQFRLKENFIPSALSEIRNAWFTTTSPVTLVAACVEGGTPSAATFDYLDPWKVDANGNQNTYRTISLAPAFGDNVFLSQSGPPAWNPPYYALNAASNATITVNGNQFAGVFQNWSYTNAIIQNASAAQTGVVFNTGATVTANYKAHLGSSILEATSSSGRKIATYDETNFYYVYTSMGSVWFTSSLGTPEVKIGVGRNPSIAVTEGNIIHIVWENTVGSYQTRVYYSRSTNGGVNWSTVEFPSYDLYGGYDANPAVFGTRNAVMAWRYGQSGVGGLRVVYEPLGSNLSLTVSSDFNAKLPAGAEQYYGSGNEHMYGLTHVNTTGQIIYNRLYVASALTINLTRTLSETNPQTGNSNPSFAANLYTTMVAAVWENSSDHKIYYRESSNGGESWGDTPNLGHSAHVQSKPSIGIVASNTFCVLFQCGQYIGKAIKDVGSSNWSPRIHLAKGLGPQMPNRSLDDFSYQPIHALLTKGSAAPYVVSTSIAPPQTKSGTIPSETWTGLINVTGTVIVPSTKILTIAAGTTVQFAPNTSLIAYGVVKTQGTAADPIELTSTIGTTPGSWGSIFLDGSGAASSNFNYTYFKYGNEFKVNNLKYYPYFVLQNSVIESFVTACNIYNSAGWIVTNTISNPQNDGIIAVQNSNISCYYNTITKSNHTGAGILYYNGSNDYIFDNTIQGFGWGIGSLWGASALCGHPANSGDNNSITDCSIGVEAYGSGYVKLGEYCEEGYPSAFMGNTIDNNSLDAYVLDNGNVDAYGVDWGGGNPVYVVDEGSYFNWCEGWYKRGSESEGASSTVADRKKGEKFRREGKHKEAAKYFNSLIAKNPEQIEPYIELSHSYSDSSADEVLKTFESLPGAAPPFAKLLLANIYLHRNEIDKAEEINSSVSREHSKKALGDRAKLNNFYITLYNRKDIEGAIELYNEVASKSYLTEPLDLELAKSALENYPELDEELKSKLKKINLVKAEVPDHYELFQNYPNPFNPSTIIDYQIPKDGMVVLKIYDMLGREVRTLVNENKSIGKYSIVFDARNLASGMYIYRLVSRPTEGGAKDAFTAVKKMVLVK